jgi:hypothetical protein
MRSDVQRARARNARPIRSFWPGAAALENRLLWPDHSNKYVELQNSKKESLQKRTSLTFEIPPLKSAVGLTVLDIAGSNGISVAPWSLDGRRGT